jgi:septal ring factor EnvC (AmiA/AmiB activator)
MTFKPAIWTPIAAVLSVLNVGAIWFAAGATQPLHATVHGGLAVAFAVWAQRLRLRQSSAKTQQLDTPIEELSFEVSKLREELSEAQERLDFTERMLAQRAEERRMEPPADR